MYVASAFVLLLAQLPGGSETKQGNQTKFSVCEFEPALSYPVRWI
jgi:hypothetical protein